eukprot:235279-Alexandrium_andersonii.AAC.1
MLYRTVAYQPSHAVRVACGSGGLASLARLQGPHIGGRKTWWSNDVRSRSSIIAAVLRSQSG